MFWAFDRFWWNLIYGTSCTMSNCNSFWYVWEQTDLVHTWSTTYLSNSTPRMCLTIDLVKQGDEQFDTRFRKWCLLILCIRIQKYLLESNPAHQIHSLRYPKPPAPARTAPVRFRRIRAFFFMMKLEPSTSTYGFVSVMFLLNAHEV
jgi:hypothetical protein